MRKVAWVLGLGAVLALSAPPPSQSAGSGAVRASAVAPEPPRFTIRSLGTLGGKSSEALAINNRGDIVGDGTLADGSTHAFLWSKGKLQDLGVLDGVNFSSAQDINDKGEIAGVSGMFSGTRSAVTWSAGKIHPLGTLPGGKVSIGLGINNAGDVIGVSQSQNGNRAVLWHNGNIQDLGTLPGATFSLARGINEKGVIVGQSDSPDGTVHAVRWRGGKIEDLGQIKTRSGKQASTIAYAIAGDGLVVGYGTTDGGALAAYWNGTSPGPVAALAGYELAELLALNDQRIAVGDATDSTQKRQIGVIVDLRRVPQAVPALFDLNTLVTDGAGWTMETASDINEGWQIAGIGIANGTRQAVVLQPLPFAAHVKTIGPGQGTVTAPGSINCGPRCDGNVAPGSLVTFHAVPKPGSAFISWSGACSGTRPTCTVQAGGSLAVQASFSRLAEPCRCNKVTTQATLSSVTRVASGNVHVSIALSWKLFCTGSGSGGCSAIIDLRPADRRLMVVTPPRARVSCLGQCSRNGGKASGSLTIELELTPELAQKGRATLSLKKFCQRGTVLQPVGVDRVDFTLVAGG